MAKTKKSQKENIEDTENLDPIAVIKKMFDSDTFVILGEEAEAPNIPKIPIGCLALDKALGGGIPKGRMIEIFGDAGAGKTTLALHIAAAYQDAGELVAYIDAENSLDVKYAMAIGVDITKMPIAQIECGEDAFSIAEGLIESGKVGLIIFDSVAALAPKSELEGDFGDANMGAHARMMSQALRKLNAKIAKSDTTLLFINQKRNKIVMFGNPETTTGGVALRFYTSVRMDVKTIGKPVEEDEIPVAQETIVKVVKNKVGPPFRQAKFFIEFGKGIDREREIIDYGVKYGIIEKSGAWYAYRGDRIGQGIDNAIKFVREYGLIKDILADVRHKIEEEVE